MKLVDCISTFHIRYVIDTDNDEWAGDTVVMEEAKEFSQNHLGELIVSIRTIDDSEYLSLFNADNEYLEEWTDEMKRSLITRLPNE
jgi:hypothetical protein